MVSQAVFQAVFQAIFFASRSGPRAGGNVLQHSFRCHARHVLGGFVGGDIMRVRGREAE